MSYYGSEYEGSNYEDATSDCDDGYDNYSQQDVASEHGSYNGEESYQNDDSQMEDAYFQAQVESVENENLYLSDSEYGPQSELDFHDELDEEDHSELEDHVSTSTKYPTKSYDVMSSNSYEDFSEMCKKWKEIY